MKNRINLKENYCYLLAPCITAAVLLAAFAAGQVFPFGSNTVAYFDMAQRFIPNLYHIWDAIHSSDTALWFNWYSGLGVNDVADASFSFFWIVLAVLPRRLIGKAMSMYVVMFFSMSAFSACLFLRKAEKTKPFIASMLSVCYAFGGFSVMYYTNMWQDTVFLFPLLMLSLVYLLRDGKKLFYILLVFLNFQCNYYTFALSLFCLFFMGYLYLVLVCDKEHRRERCKTFGLSTITGILLSSFSLVPKLMQTFSSSRFIEDTGFDFSSLLKQYLEIAGTVHCKYPEKITMLFSTALPLAIIIAGLIKKKKRGKTDAFFLLGIALLAVLIVCEGANLLMHAGDYKYFPMRMGYALSFAFIWAAGHYSQYISANSLCALKNRKNTAAIAVNAAAFLVFAAFAFLILRFADAKLEAEFSVMWAYPVLVIIYLLFILLSGKLLDYRASAGGLLAEILVLSMLFIPYWDTEHNRLEQSPEYIQESQSVCKAFDIAPSKTDRIKTIGTTLNCNYGTVMQRATVSDWTHMIPPSVLSTLLSLGYSGENTRVHDSGGTAFTDALFGIKNVLSVREESPALYDKIGREKGYKYYSCKYTLPYGIAVDKSVLDIDTGNGDWISLNNQLYKSLSGTNDDIAGETELRCTQNDDSLVKYTFTGKKNCVMYFKLQGASKVNISVNGKKVRIPSIDNEKNKKYPGRFNRNLVCIGEFGDGEKIELQLILNDGKYENKPDFRTDGEPEDNKNQNFSVQLGYLDLQKLGQLCDKFNSENSSTSVKNYDLNAAVTADTDNKVLLLPLQYNGCWSAEVGGEEAEVHQAFGFITAVDIKKGTNDVKMHFTPSGFKTGLALSVFGILAFALYMLFDGRLKKLGRFTENALYIAYSAMFCTGILLVYIIPILLNIINFIL